MRDLWNERWTFDMIKCVTKTSTNNPRKCPNGCSLGVRMAPQRGTQIGASLGSRRHLAGASPCHRKNANNNVTQQCDLITWPNNMTKQHDRRHRMTWAQNDMVTWSHDNGTMATGLHGHLVIWQCNRGHRVTCVTWWSHYNVTTITW